MEDLLILLKVIQQKKVKRHYGYQIHERLNPYNPLSYICLIIDFVFGIIMYGIVGYLKYKRNPFKYK